MGIEFTQVSNLKSFLKRKLRQKEMTYHDLAMQIGVSEVTIKRWLTLRDLKLTQLGKIAKVLDFSIFDFIEDGFTKEGILEEYTLEQEQYFVKNPTAAYIFLKSLMGYGLDEISKTAQVSRTQFLRLLKEMEKVGVLELWPGDEIRVRLRGPFRFRNQGPNARCYAPLFEKILLTHFGNDLGSEGAFRPFEMYLQRATALEFKRELLNVLEKYRQISALEYRGKKKVEPVAGIIGIDLFDAWSEVFLRAAIRQKR
jgi:transcriptional regulator with XRE-family HTH domain